MIIKNKLAYCILCSTLLCSANKSKEHLILNSLGGRKKVSGALCRYCNNQAGYIWDNALAEQLNPLSLLFKISRERGKNPAQNFETVTGQEIRLHHDGHIIFSKPEIYETKKSDKTEISIKARSVKEAKEIVVGLKTKHPNLNVAELLEKLNEQSFYLNDPLKMNFSFGGEDAYKALVKSVLTLAVKNNVDLTNCQNALNYLKNFNSEACFGFYYEKNLILNRPKDKIFHCVAIKGNPKNGLLLGYIEFFSALRLVVCLSDSYVGPDIKDIYAIDPVSGEELDLIFEISLMSEDLTTLYRCEKDLPNFMREAFDFSLAIARQRDFKNEINKILNLAVDYAFKNCGAEKDEILKETHMEKITLLVMEKLMPFLRNYYK